MTLGERVRYWQRQLSVLGVGHWEVRISETPLYPSYGAHAQMETEDDYDRVTFWFSASKAAGDGPEELDRSIIHEWIHVAMRDFDEATERAERYMSESVRDEWEDRLKHEREGLVERLARFAQESIPTP